MSVKTGRWYRNCKWLVSASVACDGTPVEWELTIICVDWTPHLARVRYHIGARSDQYEAVVPFGTLPKGEGYFADTLDEAMTWAEAEVHLLETERGLLRTGS